MKAVIFDWGGVLVDDPAEALRDYCANALNIEKETLVNCYEQYKDSFEKGKISERELWSRICNDLGLQIPKEDSLFGAAVRAVFVDKAEVYSLTKELRKNGYKVGLLSNTEVPAMNYFHEKGYDVFFDATVFSCAEGSIKPEEDIYRVVLQKLGVKPEESVFIDDKLRNVEGARTIGMHGIVFENPAQLKKELISLGVRLL